MRLFIAAMMLTAGLATSLSAQPVPKMGAIGDSLVDEHFDQGFGSSKNALELMTISGRINLGTTANWGGTRRTGYQYNWALAGSTTSSLINGNQHTNLANQISAEGITKAVMVIGANDLFPYPPTGGPGSIYEAIYTGVATQAQIDTITTQAINNFVLAAQTLKDTGVDLVVAATPDYGISPYTKNWYPNPVKRDLVDDVVLNFNNTVTDRIVNEVGAPVVDIYSLTKDIWGDHGSENSTFTLGGVDLQLNGQSGNPDTNAAFVADGIHPNNAVGGMFANLLMTAFNEEYGDNFTLFTEQDILSNAGPTLGAMYSSETITSSLGGKTYSDYVISTAVPVFGDANGDGVLSNGDIAPFVLALTNPVAYQAMYPDVDPEVVLNMNSDGGFDNFDIADFVAALASGGTK